MSMPRYTCAESRETISSGSCSASSMARRDLPLAVGPRRTTAAPGKLPSAGDVEQRAGRVRRFVGRQPEDGASDLLRLAVAAERGGAADALQARRVAAGGV